MIVPVGAPLYIGWNLWRAKPDITAKDEAGTYLHKGPHHLDRLHVDFVPESCLWPVWEMVQNGVLIGLLT